MVFCVYCGAEFTRTEHLDTHIASHQNLKQFRCPTCNASFSRQTLLKRHEATIHEEYANSEQTIDGRGNGALMSIACSSCAKAKAKCDRKIPCRRCSIKNIECQSRTSRISRKNNPNKLDHCTGLSTEITAIPDDRDPQDCPKDVNQLECSIEAVSSSLQSGQLPGMMEFPLINYQSPSSKRPNAESEDEQQQPGSSIQQSRQCTPPTAGSHHASLMSSLAQFSEGNDSLGEGGFYSARNHDSLMGMDVSMMMDCSIPEAALHDMMVLYDEQTFGLSEATSETFQSSTPISSGFNPANDMTPSGSQTFPRLSDFNFPATYPATNNEHKVVFAAQEAWSIFRCNPTLQSRHCPRTARIYLEGLIQTLRSDDAWSSWGLQHGIVSRQALTEPLNGWRREKLLAITQTFLHKALEVHRDQPEAGLVHPRGSLPNQGSFIILPPAHVLEYFLQAYLVRFEPYHILINTGIFRPNDLMDLSNGNISCMFLLLMLAQGASTSPTDEARYLSSGLTEVCRISLFDLIEKDIILTSDPAVLRCALLLTTLALWSGDKWHMDIGTGLCGLYMNMLKQAGFLDSGPVGHPTLKTAADIESTWASWRELESRSRLVYCWLTVDQEMSLFHDTAPMISTSQIYTPAPDDESLWQSGSASEWASVFQQKYEMDGYSCQRSIRDLCRSFLEGELSNRNVKLSAIQLRLLLYPLQSLTYNLQELKSSLSDGVSQRVIFGSVSKSSIHARLEEVQCLLQQWYALAGCGTYNAENFSAAIGTNCVIYHLIVLNTITFFPNIERLAREEIDPEMFRAKSRYVHEAEEIFVHCGQVLRHIGMTPENVRPPWWAAAVYRVALIAWANSIAVAGGRSFMANMTVGSKEHVKVDALPPEHPSTIQYLKHSKGIPVFSKADGSVVSIEKPINVLIHCTEILNKDLNTRFTIAIRNKLLGLAQRLSAR